MCVRRLLRAEGGVCAATQPVSARGAWRARGGAMRVAVAARQRRRRVCVRRLLRAEGGVCAATQRVSARGARFDQDSTTREMDSDSERLLLNCRLLHLYILLLLSIVFISCFKTVHESTLATM